MISLLLPATSVPELSVTVISPGVSSGGDVVVVVAFVVVEVGAFVVVVAFVVDVGVAVVVVVAFVVVVVVGFVVVVVVAFVVVVVVAFVVVVVVAFVVVVVVGATPVRYTMEPIIAVPPGYLVLLYVTSGRIQIAAGSVYGDTLHVDNIVPPPTAMLPAEVLS
jgi:hypothetical protein